MVRELFTNAKNIRALSRKKKLFLNTFFSLFYQLTSILCGFILPRFFLEYFGSSVNGLVASVSQFLGFITLAECGVGAVVQSTLYRPLAQKNELEISKIIIAAERFFRKIAFILLGYTFILMIGYPLFVKESFGYLYTALLIAVISIKSFAQYFLGISYKLLFNADQLGFIQYIIHALVLIANTVACVFLMKNGLSIHVVKLTTSVLFLVQPFLMAVLAKKMYKIDRGIELTENPIKQKWNGLTQHIAAVVLGNTDIVLLTAFSTLENVSIYSVYHLVVNGVKQIVVSLTNGAESMLGNMLAKKEYSKLNASFSGFEWFIHLTVTIVFLSTAFLIVPFVTVYTKDVSDANYIVPIFAYLITISQGLICLQIPYKVMVLAAGHYKETQWSSIIEAVINVVVSIVLIFPLGLNGVALGTIAAIGYRLIYLTCYLSKNILRRSISFFLKRIIVDIVCVSLSWLVFSSLRNCFVLKEVTWLSWICLGVKIVVVCAFVTLIVNLIFSYKEMGQFLRARKNKLRKI